MASSENIKEYIVKSSNKNRDLQGIYNLLFFYLSLTFFTLLDVKLNSNLWLQIVLFINVRFIPIWISFSIYFLWTAV